MEHLHVLRSDIAKPERFTYPFCYEPHPLCQLAAKEVQTYIATHPEIREDADHGKMFGVLVVAPPLTPPLQGEGSGCATIKGSGLFFLAAYSGLLAGRNDWDYFVPPVFDAQQPDGHFKTMERIISNNVNLNVNVNENENGDSRRLDENDNENEDSKLKTQNSKLLSQELQTWLFHQYQLLNARGEVKDLVDIWQEYYSRPKLRRKFPLPPGGTGDCCAPKLLQYAYQQGLKPVCMAEFWWGATTKTELRQHLNYYPACRGKCKPILTWMLQGLDVDPDPESLGFAHLEIPVVYEDEWLLVVNKPSGLLSTPGRIEQYSVETVMHQRYPGSIIAHRLDMGTSGLLIVAKSLEAYRPLQEQFVKHQVKKKYLAVLEDDNVNDNDNDNDNDNVNENENGNGNGNDNVNVNVNENENENGKLFPLLGYELCSLIPLGVRKEGLGVVDSRRLNATNTQTLSTTPSPSFLRRGDEISNAKGRIVLPLRPDPMNRPRQMVDMEHGKQAITDYEFITDNLIALYPQTGRTHQLRVHCAHPDGLGRPIVGDELYGTKGSRLMLHASEIWFQHPVTGEQMHFKQDFPDDTLEGSER